MKNTVIEVRTGKVLNEDFEPTVIGYQKAATRARDLTVSTGSEHMAKCAVPSPSSRRAAYGRIDGRQ